MTNSMNENAQVDWELCPRGELIRMVARLKARRRAQTLKSLGTAAIAVVAIALSVVSSARFVPGNLFGDPSALITCSEAVAMLQDYSAGRLSRGRMTQLSTHVAHCANCQSVFMNVSAPVPLQLPGPCAQPSAAIFPLGPHCAPAGGLPATKAHCLPGQAALGQTGQGH